MVQKTIHCNIHFIYRNLLCKNIAAVTLHVYGIINVTLVLIGVWALEEPKDNPINGDLTLILKVRLHV